MLWRGWSLSNQTATVGALSHKITLLLFLCGGGGVRFGKQFLFLKNVILGRHNQFYFKTIQPYSQR